MNPLAPPVPATFGPHRRKALEASQKGWCAICDTLPIPLSTDKLGRAKGKRYTCRQPDCVKGWSLLCQRDYHHARRAKAPPSGMIHRKA